jgi:hypothetical protein
MKMVRHQAPGQQVAYGCKLTTEQAEEDEIILPGLEDSLAVYSLVVHMVGAIRSVGHGFLTKLSWEGRQ